MTTGRPVLFPPLGKHVTLDKLLDENQIVLAIL